ncbi:Ig-like domain-containing protein [Caryophanon latum]|uniref:Transglutaminase-like domain-containing protein n=1 Tax=Caryophanon latum TaxID=33977 RepID=A0A1C0YQ23_9BACL|nr:Ig-like domain-containing protein [Caryophanon latum]OCS89267.1 hypothetical protein A6K76_13030 [Caryophanon latum]
MRKRLWLASPVLAFALLASTASAEEIALPTEQVTLTQTPKLVPVKFGTHTVEFIEDDRSFSSTATQTASTWEQVSDAVFKAVKNYEPQLQIKISMKDATSEQITNALNNGFGKSEYTYGIGIDAAMSVSSASILTFKFTYPVSIEKEQVITKYVKDTAAKIFSDNMTDFQKVRAAYEYIITNTNYSIAPVEDGGGHSIYSIVKDGIGVCQAYALLFQRLMEEEGIASKYIVGVAGGINHAWNLVTIDGKTYHIDATYGDPVFSEYFATYDAAGNGTIVGEQKEITMPQYVTYNTFLMSEEQLAKNAGHVITEARPYKKPSSDDFAAWHNVTNAVTLDGKHYYYQHATNYALEMADFTQPTLTPQVLPLNEEDINQVQNLVTFNDRIFFINAYGQLAQITKDGTISVVQEGYEDDFSYPADRAGYIAVTKDALKVYALDGTIENDQYTSLHHYSTEKLIYEEAANTSTETDNPGDTEEPAVPEQPVTETEIDEKFKPESDTVKQIESAISKQAFEALLENLKNFVNAPTTNEQLKAFQEKIAAYNAVKEIEKNGTKWATEFANVEQKKSWSIKFSVPVADSDKENIKVVDIFNKPLAIEKRSFTTTTVKDDTLTITPAEDYVAGADYYVVIPAGTKSAEGGILKETVYVPFSFK